MLAGKLTLDLLKRNLTPSKIVTKAAIENAIAGVAATGGSTNAVLHLLAIAQRSRAFLFPLTISIASVRKRRFWPISNQEDALSQPTYTQQAVLRSSQSACLKQACSVATALPSRDARSLKKLPKPKKHPVNKSSA